MESDNVSKIYDALQSKQAPAHTGKPIFEKHLEAATAVYGNFGGGVKGWQNLFGAKLHDGNSEGLALPVNLGKKSSLPQESRLALLELKKDISNCELQAQVMTGKRKGITANDMMATPHYKNVLNAKLKAFNTVDFANWIDEVHSRFFFDEYEIPLVLAGLFDTVPMPTPLMKVPGALGKLEGLQEACDASFTEQSNTEAFYQVEAKDCVVHTVACQNILDDSSPALIDKIRKEVTMGCARAYERAILDGATGTHIDADTEAGSAALYQKAFDGLRKRAFDADTAVGAGSFVYDHGDDTPSKVLYATLLKMLKCQAADKNDLAYIHGCAGASDLVTGAIPELFTAFAFGGLASNVTGQMPPVFGVKGVETSYVREDLETTGKALAVPVGTQTYLMLVQKSRYHNFVRQATRVWMTPSLADSDKLLMTGKFRGAFAGVPATATERNVAMGINVKSV